MKSDESIAAEVAYLTPLIGPTRAGWYGEACRMVCDDPAVIWASRYREVAMEAGRLVERGKEAEQEEKNRIARIRQMAGLLGEAGVKLTTAESERDDLARRVRELEEASQWRPVYDMPEEYRDGREMCLALVTESHFWWWSKGFWKWDGWVNSATGELFAVQPKHWMLLPAKLPP